MPIPDLPDPSALPSSAQLRRSTIVALAIALALLVAVILPAEYGVDPTRFGRLLGLTEMGEIKVTLAREAEAARVAEVAAVTAIGGEATAPATAPAADPRADTPVRAPTRADTVVVTLAPNEGKEVKLVMARGARATFAWESAGGAVNFDLHGDSTNAPNSYHSYRKGTGVARDSGEVIAAFDGSHGWFWRNRSGAPVTLTLRTNGAYSELKRLN